MNEDSLSTATLKLIGKLLLGFFGSIYGGWVIATVWGWIAVTMFGMPVITVSMAIGLLILKGMLFASLHDLKVALSLDKINKDIKATNEILDWVGNPVLYTVCLLSAALWHFMLFPLLTVMGIS
jgi:CBS-domain-containing membrane protein